MLTVRIHTRQTFVALF